MNNYDFSFTDIVDNAKDIIIVTKAAPIDSPGPEIVYVNKAFTELTGYLAEEVIGQNPRILQSSDTEKESRDLIRNALIKKEPVRTTIKNYSKNGTGYWLDISILPLKDNNGNVTHFVAIERDVSEQKETQKKLEELTRTDYLTELLNKRAFDELLEIEFSRFKRSKLNYSLIMLDIDHFKNVNDTYGHSFGDTVLTTIAQACKSNIRQHDSIARVGGEEFCILLPYTSIDIAVNIAEKLRIAILNNQISTDDTILSVTISIGVAEVSNSDNDYNSALKRADDQLYEAKKSGRNRVSS